MDENEIRAWSGNDDGHEHILGQMRKVQMSSGRHVTVLEVYRNAVDMNADHPCEVEVLGTLYGEMPIRCNVPGCTYVGTWDIHAAMLREYAMKYKKRQANMDAIVGTSQPINQE